MDIIWVLDPICFNFTPQSEAQKFFNAMPFIQYPLQLDSFNSNRFYFWYSHWEQQTRDCLPPHNFYRSPDQAAGAVNWEDRWRSSAAEVWTLCLGTVTMERAIERTNLCPVNPITTTLSRGCRQRSRGDGLFQGSYIYYCQTCNGEVIRYKIL